jgi:hypothetical protein
MFLGHFAVAFAAKKLAPSVSLGTLVIAAQLADLVWPTLVMLGVEKLEIRPGVTEFNPLDFVSYPYSHSLIALILWGVALAAIYAVLRRPSLQVILTLAALVVSHWVLDWVVHRPDLPVTIGGSERLGAGLWNSVPGTIALETLLFAVGVAVYAKTTDAVDRTGAIAFWLLVAFLFVVFLASSFGPPPPSASAVAWSAQAIWLLVAWAYWIDRHRRPAWGR